MRKTLKGDTGKLQIGLLLQPYAKLSIFDFFYSESKKEKEKKGD